MSNLYIRFGAAKEVCDVVINQEEERYKFTGQLLSENLFEFEV